MKKIILFIVVVAIGVVSVNFLKSQKKEVDELPIPKVYHYSVNTIIPKNKEVSQTRHFLAQLLASKSALVASKFSAKIKKVFVKENDMVKKGKLLISLDDSEVRANITSLLKQKSSLRLDIANVKRSLIRSEKLLKIQAISQEKYDNINVLYQNKLTSLEGLKEKIKQSKSQLTYLNIKAPFSGRVGVIFLDAGNLAIPGKPIVSLNSDDQKLIFSYVATSEPILESQKVYIDNEEVGYISRKYDDAKNALLVAEIKLTKPLPFANKAFINIDVLISKQKGCSVSLNALLHRKNKTSIMLFKDDKFIEKEVKVILEDKTDAILKECPTYPVATASEAKLSLLPSLGEVDISEEK